MSVGLLLPGLKVVLLCAAPFLVVLTLVGLGVGLVQAVTGVQDQTSAQAARVVAAGLTAALAAPFVLRTLAAFTRALWMDLGRFLQ